MMLGVLSVERQAVDQDQEHADEIVALLRDPEAERESAQTKAG